MAAALGAGPRAVVSHGTAAELWGIGREVGGPVEISVPDSAERRRPGVRVHRRPALVGSDIAWREGIPVTSVALTLVDMATRLGAGHLERMVNEADRLDLADPETLRDALERFRGRRGVARLRTLLDRATFRLTDSELERRFLPLAESAGLALPLTRQQVNGFRVDFYWPDLGLVVETDGLRYHRTPAQQARDRRRDQAHAVAGMTALRFTHAQVEFERQRVRETLREVARRVAGDRPKPDAAT
jgi:very-short-patch-repair endonuclease